MLLLLWLVFCFVLERWGRSFWFVQVGSLGIVLLRRMSYQYLDFIRMQLGSFSFQLQEIFKLKLVEIYILGKFYRRVRWWWRGLVVRDRVYFFSCCLMMKLKMICLCFYIWWLVWVFCSVKILQMIWCWWEGRFVVLQFVLGVLLILIGVFFLSRFWFLF